ncbi:MAG TPA: biotin/lipoyl-binding protein [Bryobacteraceae bacterium]|nr:biotin/lipoyl-binding protein [Bryobacteraceae bacterium]
MRNKILFGVSFAGLLAGCSFAYLLSIEPKPAAPAFNPPSNPYRTGIYMEGMVESDQPSGENINVYPEVPGTVKEILVAEGQPVSKGMPVLKIDDSIQAATAAQQAAQAEAALSLLQELRAEPRKENLDVAEAQLISARATLKTAQDTLEKQTGSYQIDPRSVSKDALDTAINAVAVAKANVAVAQRQYDLTKAGAWVYDVQNQERQYQALVKSHAASSALLAKYTLRAPRDGVVLSINAVVGSFVSTQGAYDSYTQGMDPVLVLGSPQNHLNVRCYVDEILVPRLPVFTKMRAEMSIRGSDQKLPLTYLRVQPLRISEDRAVRSENGTGRRPGIADHLQD